MAFPHSLACTTESHPLYGTLMAGASNAIFEWDQQDYLQAKRNVLLGSGVINISGSAVQISREEAALHVQLSPNDKRSRKDTREFISHTHSCHCSKMS